MLRYCAQPGCGTLVPTGFCPTHKRATVQQYDAHRGSAHSRGYGVKWRNYVLAFRTQLQSFDIPIVCGARLTGLSAAHSACIQRGVLTGDLPGATLHTDHIIPHEGDERLLHDLSNFQNLCGACHNAKTNKERETGAAL